MRRLMAGWRRFRALLRRDDLEGGLDEEIRFHIEQQTEKNRRAGMTPGEARRQALIRFGGVEGAKERTREQFRYAAVEGFLRDLRHGGRTLLHAPGFTAVAVSTLALGIGVTTAMFSVLNGILLRALPYPEQDRLVELVHEAPGFGIAELFASPAIYFAYRDHSRTFASVGLWDWDSSPVTVTGPGVPEAVQSVEVTHEILEILGADAALGRRFNQADDLPGSAPTAIISHAYWRRRFAGADPLGQTLVVDGIPRQVIGVLPQSFTFFEYPADLFYPLQPVRSEAVFPSFDGRGIARMKEGVTLRDANADVARMIPILTTEFAAPGANFDRARFGPALRRLKDTVVGELGDTLWLLMGTIGLLLVIACANVANLVLVRTQARRPELAVRAALGAGWAAIARVVFTESLLLGLAGGAVGLAVAHVGLPLLLSRAGADLPHVMTVTIDRTVLLVTLGVSVLATLMFAIVPLVHVAWPGIRLTRALRGVGRAATDGPEGNRARHVLVIAQVALAVVLLVGSGLMIRTFQSLRQVDPGFRDPAGVQTFQLTIPDAVLAGADRSADSSLEQRLRLQHAIVDRLAAVGGVESAGFSAFNDGLPLDGDGRAASILVEGRSSDTVTPAREIQFVSPGFFETLRTPLVAGRAFDWTDVHQGGRVVMVSENLARAEWDSAAAAPGKRIRRTPSSPWLEVVGVVKDVHHEGLSRPAPQIVVFPAVASETASFVVRSERVGTPGFLEELRQAVWSANGNLSLAGVRTLGDMYERSMARTSMSLQLLAITGGMALLLNLLGIYGVVSYAVTERRREIGIRLALGAARREVRRIFVRYALVLAGIGVALGLGAAAALTRLMASQLFGVNPLDPPTLAAVALLLAAAAGLAAYLPAHRASALDPAVVLKGE